MVTDYYNLYKQATREGYAIYTGSDAAKLSTKTKQSVAKQVALEIKQHPYTMIPYTAQEILVSLNEGRAGCILGQDGRLLSFVQAWAYERESEQFFQSEENFGTKTVYEIGTWLSFERGFGSKLLMTFLGLWKHEHPEAEIITIIEKGNRKATNIFKDLGGKHIGYKVTSNFLDEQGKNPEMNIYKFREEKK